MNDSQKMVEALHGVSWKQGLSKDIMKGVQSFFATNSEGEIGVSDHDLRLAAAGTSASSYDSPVGSRSSVNGIYVVLFHLKLFIFIALF